MTRSGNSTSPDRRSRSLAKAISWRLVALVVLASVSFFFTGSWQQTTLITAVYSILQVFIYFLHERIWSRIRWGRSDPVEQIPPIDDITPAEADHIIGHLKELGYIEGD